MNSVPVSRPSPGNWFEIRMTFMRMKRRSFRRFGPLEFASVKNGVSIFLQNPTFRDKDVDRSLESGEIVFASRVALQNRLARIARSFPVVGSLCEREVRPLKRGSLIRSADGWIAQVPAGVSGKRNRDLGEAHA